MKKYSIDFQLSPPHMHHKNSAEQASRVCKNHFISGLSTTDPDLPISKWERILYKCLNALNLFHNSRFDPDISAYAYLYGPYDFNKSPVAPPVTHMIFHDKPVNFTSWSHHGTPVWYIGPSLHHYR